MAKKKNRVYQGGVALSVPATRTVVVEISASDPEGDDFRDFPFGGEDDLPTSGVEWYQAIHPVVAIRAAVFIDYDDNDDHMPRVETEFLVVGASWDSTRLTTIEELERYGLRANAMYQAFVCHWPPEQDEEQLRDAIQGMKYRVWRPIWGKYRGPFSSWVEAKPAKPARPKALKRPHDREGRS